ncbi:hypothetical protein MTR67_034727 [Solanum verrucosum]|uniref:Uncharacterized protein n=1 Tax=Solanum verrucosum TaxID=315347 RepID=A0AAF0ZJI4_SOLVR|nr:hypothetical protein MTR67_034727 [Solanum verrucosum]
MPNYKRERLNSRFSITIHRIQYSRLNKLKDTSHLQTARLIEFMQNYGHELLNSMTSWVTCNSPMIRNIISKGLELEDTTPLKDAQFPKFMRNLWTGKTRIEGLHNNLELIYTALLILMLNSLKLCLRTQVLALKKSFSKFITQNRVHAEK